MSITNGYFLAEDGEEIKIAFVAMVEPLQGNNGGSFYEVVLSGGAHFTVKESYFTRSDFIAAWKAV